MKTCCKCGILKHIVDFYRDNRSLDGRYGHCKKCQAEADRRWRARHPVESGKISRRSQLKRKFGLTLERLEELKNLQGRRCLICKTKPAKLCIDHNHQTGIFRGLLCNNCNTGLGLFYDSPERLRAAANYLELDKAAK